MKLYELTEQCKEVEASLEESGFDAETVADTLEGMFGEFEDKAIAIAQMIQNHRADAAKIKEAIAGMSARAKRLEDSAEWLSSYLLANMLAIGERKISSPYFVIAAKKNPPSVIVDDEASIPDRFLSYKPAPAPVPNKVAIKAAIAAGEVVAGARLEQSTKLDIR